MFEEVVVKENALETLKALPDSVKAYIKEEYAKKCEGGLKPSPFMQYMKVERGVPFEFWRDNTSLMYHVRGGKKATVVTACSILSTGVLADIEHIREIPEVDYEYFTNKLVKGVGWRMLPTVKDGLEVYLKELLGDNALPRTRWGRTAAVQIALKLVEGGDIQDFGDWDNTVETCIIDSF